MLGPLSLQFLRLPTHRRLGRVGLLLAAWLLLGADSCHSVVHIGDPPDCGTDPPPKSCQSPTTQPAARQLPNS
jgi:hypothetical protein